MNSVNLIINEMPIKLRADGRYEGRIINKGHRKSFYGTTKTEVKNKAKAYLKRVENGYKEPTKIIFSEYAEYWLTTYKKGKIEPTSYTRLYRVYNSQVKDSAIGKAMIGNIKTADIQNIIDEYANPSDEKVQPLALSGLKKIVQFLNPCFKTAIKEGIIFVNPCEDVVLPSESYVVKETKEQYSLSDKEIEIFRNLALEKYSTTGEYRSRNAIVLLLILNLGLRAGEALVLEWSDVSFENKLLYINKTLQCGIKNEAKDENNAYITRVKKSTKTKSGIRVLKLNDSVMFYLNELQEYDKRNNIISKYVCCNKYGKRNNHRNLQCCLNAIVKRSKIFDHITLHTLRHTFGSTLLRKGVSIAVISKLMGHANIAITYNKYIHTIKEEEAKAMEMVQIC